MKFGTGSPFRLNVSHISYETLDTIINLSTDTILLSIKNQKRPLMK